MKTVCLIAFLVCLQQTKAQNNKNITKEGSTPTVTLSEYQRAKKFAPLTTSIPKTTTNKNTTSEPVQKETKAIYVIKPEATDTIKK